MNKVDIGIDIGGTKIQMGYLKEGKLEIFYHRPTPQSPDEAIKQIVEGIKSADLPEINKIGIGCPGPLDQRTGVILSPPNLPRWKDFPITDWLSEQLGVSVKLENDGNAGALGEAVHGSGKNHDTVYYHAIGTGFGSGLVIDGKVHSGFNGLAAEVWAFDPGMFFGGEHEIINDVVSGKGLVKQASKLWDKYPESSLKDKELSSFQIFNEMKNGDLLAVACLDKARRYLAASISFACYVLAPDIVVLGGSLCTSPEGLVDPVTKMVQDSFIIPQLKNIPIKRASLWKDAVIYGAISL